jgi:hypothetical protein
MAMMTMIKKKLKWSRGREKSKSHLLTNYKGSRLR